MPETRSFGPFRLDPGRRLVTEAGRPVALGGRAFDLLIALIERPGELVTKAELMARAWPGIHVEEGSLRVQISALRHALGERTGANYIAANAGLGYRFVAPQMAQAAIGSAPERRLPSRLTRTIGRDADIAAICERLATARLLTIVGPGGIGKTTLALACAHMLQDRFADGAAFAEVTSGGGPAMAVAAALGLNFSEDRAVEALAGFIAPLELLVVLDSCEFSLAPATELAEAILRRSPGSVVLCTSRESLRAEGEVIWRIAPLAAPSLDQEISAEEALTFPAVRLFVDRASAADQRFSLVDAEVAAVSRLCRRLDGLPLAIELAAGGVATFGLKGIEAALDNRFQQLLQGRRTALPRHRTLAATIDWSYDQLGEQEQRALRSFSLFQGPFDADDAAHLALGAEAGADSVLAVLANLVAKSLVMADVDPAPGEYRLLDSTRDYARVKLEAAGERNSIAGRHAARTLEVFTKADSELERLSKREWISRFGRKLEDVRAALDWAFAPAGDLSTVVPLTLAAIPVWMSLARDDECWRRAEAAARVVEPGSADQLALEIALGFEAINVPDKESECVQACERAVKLARNVGDHASEFRATWVLWNIHIANGRVQPARKMATHFSELADSAPGLFEKLIADRALGISELLLGNLPAARAATERVRAASPGWYERERLRWYAYDPDTSARNTLVTLLWLEGKPDSAFAAAQENLTRVLADENEAAISDVITDAPCGMALMIGDDDAVDGYLNLLDVFIRRGAAPNAPYWAEIARAVLAAGRGEVEPGVTLLNKGLEPAARHPRFAILLAELAERIGVAGAIEPARRLADDFLRRVELNGEFWILSEIHRIRGQLCDDDDEARKRIGFALDTARSQGTRTWELRAATSLARRWPETAGSVLAPLLNSFTEGHGTRDLIAAKEVLAAS